MEDRELTFWEHLDVLRWALVRIVVLWFLLAIGFFIAMPYIFDPVIMGPCHDNFVFYGFLRKIGEMFNLTGDFFTQRFDIKLQNINLAAPFFVHLTTSFVLSIVILVPYIFWEIWLFIRPALYPNEAAGVRKALLLGNVMFYVGMAVGYFMVYPLALRFLSTYDLSDNIDTLISLNSYIDNFMMLILAMGIAFELPLVTWLLSLFGLLTRSTLREYRRHAIVVIVIAAAIITPTGDPFTLTAVALPLYALYELSIFMIKESKDDDEEEEETVNSKAAGNKPDGPNPALEKKPDGGGDPDAPAAEAKEIKPEDKDIHETLRLQREAAEQAKVEAKNKALQERLDKAAAAGVAGATAETAEAADGTVKELTANTEPSVKDALAEAATTTAKKTRIVKKREPRMVIVNDEIFWEEGPEIEVEEEIPESEETDQATEQKAADNTPTAAVDSPTEAVSEEATTDVLAETPTEAPTDVPAEMPADAAPKKAPVAESSLESPYMDETVNQPEALQTPYYDDPEAMPDLSKYYAEVHQEMAEEAASLSEAIPPAPTTPVSPSANDIVEQARMAAENARKAAEQAVKAAQEAARIAEETAKAAEEAAKAAAEEAAKAAAKSAIDVSGIRYDYGRFNS
jgi:sec-independent protein translocase protein TatC